MRPQPLGTEHVSTEPSGLAQLSDQQIGQLVDGLNSLMEGEAAASMLVRCGARAVPQVTDYLLFGRISSIPVPRRRAVKVLADLGAIDSLIAYLEHERHIEDPILRFSEEAVASLAAELLGRWPGDRTFNALTRLAERKMLIGICIAYGQMKRPEAVPFLIRALADGVCARSAEEALLQIGRVAVPALCSAARLRDIRADTEAPSSIQRRRFVLRVLRSIGIEPQDWAILRPLSHDPDPAITAYVCMAGMPVAAGSEQILLASLMLKIASNVNWFVQSEIQQTLLENYSAVEWVVRQYAIASTDNPGDCSGSLARSIVAKATGAELDRHPAVRAWPARIVRFFGKRIRRGEDG